MVIHKPPNISLGKLYRLDCCYCIDGWARRLPFLRPHAQHGLLAKAKIGADNHSVDYRDMIAGILRVNMTDAIKWLGDGGLLTPHVLFPSPVYDFGYRDLLNFAPASPKFLGAIHHIAA